MNTVPIYVLRNGALISTVNAVSKYDAKLRKERLQDTYPDCQIVIGDFIGGTDGKTEVQRTSDVESNDI